MNIREYEVGDAPLADARRDDTAGCGAQADNWVCTLPPGHDGRHEAAGITHVWASWKDA